MQLEGSPRPAQQRLAENLLAKSPAAQLRAPPIAFAVNKMGFGDINLPIALAKGVGVAGEAMAPRLLARRLAPARSRLKKITRGDANAKPKLRLQNPQRNGPRFESDMMGGWGRVGGSWGWGSY